jgi:chloramphenicol O-acetyltransferase
MREIDLTTWSRNHQFKFFRDYELPFFNICAPIPVGKVRQFCKAQKVSFFLTCIYLTTKAANAIPEMALRIRGETVVQHDLLHPSCTVLDADDRFRFCQFTYHDDFLHFIAQAEQAKAACIAAPLVADLGDEPRDDVLHMSVIPWVSFTSFSHAKRVTKDDAIPKIVFGKYQGETGKETMPVSVEVHHSLMDGIHMGRYFEQLEALCHAPEKLLLK